MTTITKRNFLSTLSAAALLALGATAAQAAEPLKIGMVLPMSGPFASYGKQIEAGARLYLAQNGGTFSGRKVELIIKDDTGVAPEISKRAAQELVVKDKVDILAGFGLTPSAFAVAPIATEAKKLLDAGNKEDAGRALFKLKLGQPRNHRFAIEGHTGDDLQPRLLRMNRRRQIKLVGQGPALL